MTAESAYSRERMRNGDRGAEAASGLLWGSRGCFACLLLVLQRLLQASFWSSRGCFGPPFGALEAA
jgi:hypothetical protein